MSAPLPPGWTRPASPQPGKQDERRCVCGHVLGEHDVDGERQCLQGDPDNPWECDCSQFRAAAAADQPGAGGEADGQVEESKPPWAYGRVFPCTVTDELALPGGDSEPTPPAPSAGQDTDDRRCGRCGQIPYVHGLPDSPCVYEPTESAGQDTWQLRDERPDILGRPAVLPGDVRKQVREAIRRELIAWGYSQDAADADPRRLPVESLSTDLTGAVLRLDIVRRALDLP